MSSLRLDAEIMNDYFPPTPAPSLPSPSMNGHGETKPDAPSTAVDHKSYPHFTKSNSAPPMGPLPPTPPEEEAIELQRLKIDDEGVPQRIRRGRTPIITSPTPGSERTSSETGEGHSAQRLTVDLEGYSGDFDESREPTLSFHTSSTVESTTGTPSSTHHNYSFGSTSSRDKAGQEQQFRIRSTNGRATAYSSAESSGAYSYHQYENHLFHPHPPPLPDRPAEYVNPIGLGYPSTQVQDNLEADEVLVPDSNFSYRPWESEEVNRSRSHSGVSLSSVASTSRSSRGQSSSLQHYDYHYPESLPWDTQRALENESQAVTMVEEGREKTLDMNKLREMGGIEAITEKQISTMSGITHLLLSGCGDEIVDLLPTFLRVLAPTLVVLDISHNSFTELPVELKQCLSLEELNLSSNPIKGVVPHFVGSLFSLRQLQMDNCTIHTLPAELQDLANLHTLCLRRNRLVSLPSWLCHLTQLEILKVDENPFCREWQPIVAPILASTDLNKVSSPYIPARAPSQSAQGMRAAHSASSLASSVCSTPSGREMVTSPSIESVFHNTPISATPSLTNLGPLDAIAEDGPHSAPLRAPSPYTPISIQPEMRRMKSAGDLLDTHNEDDTATPTPPLRTARADSEYLPMPTASSSRLANIASSSSTSRISSPMEESRSAPIGMTASTSKSGKWGFLRKMSMNRLKPADKAALVANSAASNIKLMPPVLTHANTEPLHPPGGRPAFRSNASAMTLPGRQGSIAEVNEFGQPSRPNTPSTPMSMFGGFGRSQKGPTRGKRRSFLPIDTPPSISLALPSAVPLMFENGFELPTSPPRPDISTRSASLSSSVSQSEVSRPQSLSDSHHGHGHDYERDARYASGLESIKSYLRDLYDLSRPSIEPVGSFEVIAAPTPDTPGSAAPNSPNTASSASVPRSSIADARRVGLNIDRRPSIASDGTGGSSTSQPVDGKKFKNDKSKRARILREIYETERTYVRGLGELVSIYVKPSGVPVNSAKPTSETVIPASERKIVFGGIESIMTIHRDNLLPALERAIRDLIDNGDDEEGEKSKATAHAIGEVFRTYIAYMKQYSTYINNFDNAQSRMRHWMSSSTWTDKPGVPSSKTATGSLASVAGLGASVAALPMSEAVPHTGSAMTAAQRKRTKTFLKRCRTHPMHSQINLEAYLLLPIQRVPRYKLLLEDLAMCTPPRETGPKDKDTLDDALAEISGLASLMNEEKREADSRLRLYHWQKRITGRGPSPLVQPHRKLILDGRLTLIRLVKKASTYVEVDRTEVSDGDTTIMPHKIVVPVDHIAPEPMDRVMVLILCSDMMVLAQPRNDDSDGLIDLYNVLRLTSVKESASIVNGNIIRLVDHKSIYYFNGVSDAEALKWCEAINNARKR